MKIKKIMVVIVFILVGIFLTFKYINYKGSNIEEYKGESVNKSNKEEVLVPSVGAWLVDWDLENGFKEIEKTEDLNIISIFSVNFNERYELLISDRVINTIKEVKENRSEEIYLTIVNDIIKDDNTSILKSNDLVRDIITNDIRKNDNINRIVELATELDIDGIDLDYEKIDEDIWSNFSIFINDLSEALSNKGKKLRVVLEPKAPIEDVKLPEGCEYIMMAYNLYGYHSEQGPKADKKFIKGLCSKITKNLKDVRIAFSLGGFSWSESGDVISLSNEEIEEILKNNNIDPLRDNESWAMYFNYLDENGVNNTVWYSDEATIKEWIKAANDSGINKIDIWRLGRNFN